MKVRSVCVWLMACTMLFIPAQTDLAFASLDAIKTSATAHSISTASWAVVAGANSSATATGAYGPITPWSQSCTSGSQVSRTINGSWTSSSKTVVLNDVSGLWIGMAVTEDGVNNIVNSGTNRITNINTGSNLITLTTGGNSGGSGTTLYFDAAARIVSSWSNSSTRVTVDVVTGISSGMTVTGTGIVNSGSNTVSSVSTGNKTVTLTTGGNTSPQNTILVFKNGQVCSNTYNEFFSVNNTGTVDVAKVALTESFGTVVIQSCNTGGVGTPYAAWNEGARTCGGVINTVVTDGLSHALSVLAGGTVRLRAFSSSSDATTSISVSVSTSDLRDPTITNQ